MNRTETAMLLAYAATRDNRKDDEAAVEGWFDDLGDLPFEDCKAAVRQHFQTTTDYLLPGHIRAIVRTIKAERIRAAGDISDRIPRHIEALEGDEHTRASLDWLRNTTRRIGDGEPLDEVAPRLQLVDGPYGHEAEVRALTAELAEQLKAPGTKPRAEGETA